MSVSATTEVFDAFKLHCHGTRIDTKTFVFNLIRKAYPDYHVTETEERLASLFEYAAAGKATAIYASGEESWNATRKWHSVGEGVEKKLHPGSLSDDYRFLHFQYLWEGNEYLGYYVVWKDMLDSEKHMFYVLYPKGDDNVHNGHCKETDKLLVAAGKWTSQLHEEVWVFDDGQWEKNKDLWKSVNGSSWDDVILDPDMKKNLVEDVHGFFNNQQAYTQFAVPWKRGIILHGVPGNGKTLSIKSLVNSLYNRPDNIPALYVKSLRTECQTLAYAVRQIFVCARAAAPCLLIFEDLDSMVEDEVRSYFLNEVDGLESNDGILMIGSTNHLDRLDPAIAKRPSRFDRKYHFKLPGEAERTAYAEYWRNKLLKNATVEFPKELCPVVAQLTEGFSFAYLKELFVMALLSLARGSNGDEYEIITAEDAATVKEEEKVSAGAGAEVKSDVCECNKKCQSCGKPAEEQSKKEEKPEEKKEKEEEPRKAKMTMPTVEIPEQVADNVLLKVMKHQIRILHSDMDNTKEEDSTKPN